MTADRWRPYAALAAGVVCIAWSGLLVRWAGVPGVAAGFYRMLFASVVLLPWCLARGGGSRLNASGMRILAVASGVLFACDNALFNIAVQRTAVAEATLLANVSPVIVAFIAWVMFGERPHRGFWGGLLFAIAGCATILLGAAHAGPLVSGIGAGSPNSRVIGDFDATLAAAFFAAYLVATERARAAAGTLSFTTWTVCTGAVVLFAACVVLGVPLTGYPPHAWAALAALGLVSQVCGYLAITYALGRLPATVISVGLLAQAPVTAVIAAALLGEGLSLQQMAGGLLVLAGIYAVIRRPATPRGTASQSA